MVNRLVPGRILGLGVAAVAWASVAAAPADAQTQREGRWQFTVPINFVSSHSVSGEGGSSLDVNSDVGWGFTFGYNLNERFMVGFETTWLSANYDANVVIDENGDGTSDGTTKIGGRLDAFNLQGVGQFNLLEETLFTPFLRANLGLTYTDSNIASAPPQGSCWWHPWWGYICGTWQPTYDRTSFSFGGGVGVRADVSRSFFLELSVNGLWVNLEGDTPFLDGIRLNIGWLP